MFLHIGKDVALFQDDIIAIIDRKTIEESGCSMDFVEDMIDNNRLYNHVDNVRTYIITNNNGNDRLYTSNISATTLSKRNNGIKTGLEVKSNEQ